MFTPVHSDRTFEYLPADGAEEPLVHIISHLQRVRVVTITGMTLVLSESEREFILGGIRADVREDGRGCRHIRHFSLRTGVVSNTSGSSLIERVLLLCVYVSVIPFTYSILGEDQCYN